MDSDYQKWLDALESDEYDQGTGGLCTEDNEGVGLAYCCLGVATVAVFDETFTQPDPGSDMRFEDSMGNTLILSHERGEKLRLNRKATDEEMNSVGIEHYISLDRITRQSLLTQLNDDKLLSFKEIAAVIRRFGWGEEE